MRSPARDGWDPQQQWLSALSAASKIWLEFDAIFQNIAMALKSEFGSKEEGWDFDMINQNGPWHGRGTATCLTARFGLQITHNTTAICLWAFRL